MSEQNVRKCDQNLTIPHHVPPELVKYFDFRTGLGDRPHDVVAALHDGPPIFYSPRSHQVRGGVGSGTWIVTSAQDIRDVLQDTETFSSASNRSYVMGDTWRLIPLELDPPEHGKWRKLLNPIFSPKAIEAHSQRIRSWAIELIEELKPLGATEFISEFSERYPVGIFLDLLGLPRSDMARFRKWVDIFVHDPEDRGIVMAELKAYLEDVMVDRRTNPGGEDLITLVTQLEIDGRPVTDEEALGVCFLMFVGGLDTVVSSLGFHLRYLAENPEDQKRLRENPKMLPVAVEELFRAFPVVTVGRKVTRDTTIHGVQLKAGDFITTSTLLATSDPREFENPGKVDITRDPNRHNAFSFGPHRCLGSHLARTEVTIALEEWLKRIPDFSIAPGAKIKALGGGVVALESLPLVWKVA